MPSVPCQDQGLSRTDGATASRTAPRWSTCAVAAIACVPTKTCLKQKRSMRVFGESHSEVVLIPLGVARTQWLTPSTVTDCQHQLEAQSSFIGMQVYAPSGDGAPRVRVRFRPWWKLHQQAELLVDLQPNHSSPARTTVSLTSGLRLGVAISLLVWIAVLLAPLIAFPSAPTKVFFALLLVLPVISVLITARLQGRSAIRRLRVALPAVPAPANPFVTGGDARVC